MKSSYPKVDGKILLRMGSNITDGAFFKFLAGTSFLVDFSAGRLGF